jgi:agmatinase
MPQKSPPAFDPGAAAQYDGIFALPHTVEQAKVVVIPVPWDATTSYRSGTSDGPAAVLEASRQVDLFDLETGRPYEAGIAMLPIPREIVTWNARARRLAKPVIEAGGPKTRALQRNVAQVNALGDRLNEWVRVRTGEFLDAGKIVAVLGGDHSTPFGAFQAYAERRPGVGILHFDAHYDLRDSYEGFTWSHASIMHAALTRISGVERIVHVGIRDFSEEEHATSRESGGRSVAFHDVTLKNRLADGQKWTAIADDIVSSLPREVFVSFDIDGLDPTLCPGTGTPVPGGLSFHQATSIPAAVVRSGRRIVGCDLNEVAPREGDGEWNANVGARLLYKMIGFAVLSQARAKRRSE